MHAKMGEERQKKKKKKETLGVLSLFSPRLRSMKPSSSSQPLDIIGVKGVAFIYRVASPPERPLFTRRMKHTSRGFS